jgi:hypothetical protein
MKKLLCVITISLACGACAGVFTPGVDPVTGEPTPSPWKAGLTEAAETYDESPWADFGPYGAGLAALIAGAAGVAKGRKVLKARKEAKTNE